MTMVLHGLPGRQNILFMVTGGSRPSTATGAPPRAIESVSPKLNFEDWYEREIPRLVAVISLAAHDRDLGAELAAEACARAWERWERVGGMKNPSGWTYTVAMNLLKRKKRREKMERVLLRQEHIANVPPPDDPASDIWDAVAELSDRQRMMVGLRYVEDLSEPAIAEIMGVATGTVGATLSQARSKLRSRLADPSETEA